MSLSGYGCAHEMAQTLSAVGSQGTLVFDSLGELALFVLFWISYPFLPFLTLQLWEQEMCVCVCVCVFVCVCVCVCV